MHSRVKHAEERGSPEIYKCSLSLKLQTLVFLSSMDILPLVCFQLCLCPVLGNSENMNVNLFHGVHWGYPLPPTLKFSLLSFLCFFLCGESSPTVISGPRDISNCTTALSGLVLSTGKGPHGEPDTPKLPANTQGC